jgi:hypothetical protein
MRAWMVWLVPCSLALACGGTNSSSGFADGGGGSGSGSGSLTGGSSGGSGGSSGSSGSSSGSLLGDAGGSGDGGNGCSGAATDYVYVLSAENKLYSFAPNLKQFTLIGTLGCQTTLQPNSMAVDRNADAYVNYISGTGQGVIYKVSTQDASCGAQPVVNLPAAWAQIGMGYSTIGTSTSEALYVDGIGAQGGNSGSGLGLVDFGKGTVGPIGPFTGQFAGVAAELTGTGDGRLFAFFTTTPVYVAQVDKSSGATQMPVPMTGVQTPQDWAFSFWGGHFYLYTSQGMLGSGGSDVTDYNPVTGTIDTTYMTSIGFDIVGAGVSTCAPTVAPQ